MNWRAKVTEEIDGRGLINRIGFIREGLAKMSHSGDMDYAPVLLFVLTMMKRFGRLIANPSVASSDRTIPVDEALAAFVNVTFDEEDAARLGENFAVELERVLRVLIDSYVPQESSGTVAGDKIRLFDVDTLQVRLFDVGEFVDAVIRALGNLERKLNEDQEMLDIAVSRLQLGRANEDRSNTD